jgi:hypothetical protein
MKLKRVLRQHRKEQIGFTSPATQPFGLILIIQGTNSVYTDGRWNEGGREMIEPQRPRRIAKKGKL